MKTKLKHKLSGWTLWGILLALPFIREFSTNGTVDALIGIVVWSIMVCLGLMGIIVLGMGVIFWANSDNMTIPELEKAHKPLAKFKWWKSLLTGSTVIAAYAYVDWTGPAVVYFLALAAIVGGATILRSTINNAIKEHKESNTVHEDDA